MKKLMIFLLLVISVLLCADIPEGYYDGTDGLNGEELKAALHNIIDDHVEYPYSSGGTDVWDMLKETDRDPDNSDNIILFYTGWSVNGEQEYNNGSGWNREHTWAKSHGDFGNSAPCGTDAHHLRPTDISVNGARGNLDFDNGGNPYIDGDGPTGCFSDNDSWEPRDEVKGDVARIIMYMAVRYEGDSGELDLEMTDQVNSSPSGQPLHGKSSTLLAWHHLDPPSEFEMNRNDVVYSYQENRNPFIDHPEFVARVWEGVDAQEAVVVPQINITAYPNPFNPNVTISYSMTNSSDEVSSMTIYNMKGQVVKSFVSHPELVEGSTKSVTWNGTDNSNNSVGTGVYYFVVKAGNEIATKKISLIK